MHRILLTGIAGFIGFHLGERLLKENFEVVGIDNLNDYYDPKLKIARLNELGIDPEIQGESRSTKYNNLSFYKCNLEDRTLLENLFKEHKFDYVINLAAQAGVRYSFVNPDSYIERNVIGFFNILEILRKYPVKHLVYASSSSVYGLNTNYPFKINDNTDHPASLYAATKKMNELMTHTYSNLFDIPSTGLRFFTVYGPWGRPDMMPFLLADSISKGTELKVYDNGNLWRDYTYVDDIVEGVFRILEKPPTKNDDWDSENPLPATSSAPYRVLNIGNGNPVKNIDFIKTMEDAFGKKGNYEFVEAPKTEVFKTYADTSELKALTGYEPKVNIIEGIRYFVDWYKEYFNI